MTLKEAIRVSKINDDYFIDTEGNIYSRPRWRTTGGLLVPFLNAYGYLQVRLKLGRRRALPYLHRLVAQAFIPNPDDLPEVNHIDGNKLNNAIDNLEWCTSQENTAHAWRTRLQKRVAKSGERYIYIDKATGRFRVVISGKHGRKTRIGRFVTLNDAMKARDKWLQSV